VQGRRGEQEIREQPGECAGLVGRRRPRQCVHVRSVSTGTDIPERNYDCRMGHDD